MAATLCLIAAAASGHSRMDTTTPADGAVLAEAPANVILEFAKPIRLTRVESGYSDETPVELDLGEQKQFANRFVVPLAIMGGGVYRIAWRGLARDGHVMQGVFSFQVQ